MSEATSNVVARAILNALGLDEAKVTAVEFTSKAGQPEFITVTYLPGRAPTITQRLKIEPVPTEDA